MTQQFLRIQPRDPIVARDGRPFGAGQATRMRGLPWPYPQMLAGSLRTLAGKLNGAYDPEALLQISARGPLPVRNESLYLPTPSDLLLKASSGALRLRPDVTLQGCSDLPNQDLSPCMLPLSETDDFKPAARPAFFSLDAMTKWLLEDAAFGIDEHNSMQAPKSEERTHVYIDSDTFAHRESMLFSTMGLDFADGVTLSACASAPSPYADHLRGMKRQLHPLGGERRLASWRTDSAAGRLWECPAKIRKALKDARRVRMVLASPAVWQAGGWCPQWALGSTATVPGTNLVLKLAGACVDHWKPISGYSLVKTAQQPRGPKPVRWMAPAGATYFFDVISGNAEELANLWLTPIADNDQPTQEARDGFGLAVWGIWSPNQDA